MMKREPHHFLQPSPTVETLLVGGQCMNDIGFKNKFKLLELINENSNKKFIIIPSLDYGYPGGFIKLEGDKFNLYCNNIFTHEITCVEVAKDKLPDSGHFITEFWKD